MSRIETLVRVAENFVENAIHPEDVVSLCAEASRYEGVELTLVEGYKVMELLDVIRPSGDRMNEKYDEIGQIIAYESGELDTEETVELFQHLINNGKVWQLQGSYGRMAAHLIEKGYCTIPKEE